MTQHVDCQLYAYIYIVTPEGLIAGKGWVVWLPQVAEFKRRQNGQQN